MVMEPEQRPDFQGPAYGRVTVRSFFAGLIRDPAASSGAVADPDADKPWGVRKVASFFRTFGLGAAAGTNALDDGDVNPDLLAVARGDDDAESVFDEADSGFDDFAWD